MFLRAHSIYKSRLVVRLFRLSSCSSYERPIVSKDMDHSGFRSFLLPEVFSSKTFPPAGLFGRLSRAMLFWHANMGWLFKFENGVLWVRVGLGGHGLRCEVLRPGCCVRWSTIKSFIWGCTFPRDFSNGSPSAKRVKRSMGGRGEGKAGGAPTRRYVNFHFRGSGLPLLLPVSQLLRDDGEAPSRCRGGAELNSF